ncbi:thermonuclease family protein [Mesorhizobium sp. A556]
MRIAALFAVTVALVITASANHQLVGRASIIDGDTIEIHGERVRFNGIDAPESRQLCQDAKGRDYQCGQIAANALNEFLSQSRPTRCDFVERDQYGRFVGNCYRADGSSVQRWLVSNGHAMDWPRYSQGAYATQQSAARSKRLGIWVGKFQPPWEWRSAEGKIAVAPVIPLVSAAGNSDCKIKGNISRKGQRIYHVPGQKYYANTQITEGKGERWFCTEDEAHKAGWRKSKT